MIRMIMTNEMHFIADIIHLEKCILFAANEMRTKFKRTKLTKPKHTYDSSRFRFNQHKEFLPAVHCAQVRTCTWKEMNTNAYAYAYTYMNIACTLLLLSISLNCCVTMKSKRGYTNSALL